MATLFSKLGRMWRHRWIIVAPLALGLLALLWWGLRPLRLLERRAQHLFDGSMGAADGWPRAGGEIDQAFHDRRKKVSTRYIARKRTTTPRNWRWLSRASAQPT